MGLSNWLELSSTRTFGQPQPRHWLLVPLLGTQRWSYTLEAKVIAPNLANNYSVAEYRTPFGTHGALGVYVGVTRNL